MKRLGGGLRSCATDERFGPENEWLSDTELQAQAMVRHELLPPDYETAILSIAAGVSATLNTDNTGADTPFSIEVLSAALLGQAVRLLQPLYKIQLKHNTPQAISDILGRLQILTDHALQLHPTHTTGARALLMKTYQDIKEKTESREPGRLAFSILLAPDLYGPFSR